MAWRCKKCGAGITAVVPHEAFDRRLEFNIKKNKGLGKLKGKIIDYLPYETPNIRYWCENCYGNSTELEEIAEWEED